MTGPVLASGAQDRFGSEVTGLNKPHVRWYASRIFLSILTTVAVCASVAGVVSERKQGFSFFWRAEGTTVYCASSMLPHYSVVRQYSSTTINAIAKAPYSQDASIDVVVLDLNGLQYSIPTQSSAAIRNFDAHIEGLQEFISRVHDGDDTATYSYLHPIFVTMIVSFAIAVLAWVTLFILLWRTGKRAQ